MRRSRTPRTIRNNRTEFIGLLLQQMKGAVETGKQPLFAHRVKFNEDKERVGRNHVNAMCNAIKKAFKGFGLSDYSKGSPVVNLQNPAFQPSGSIQVSCETKNSGTVILNVQCAKCVDTLEWTPFFTRTTK